MRFGVKNLTSLTFLILKVERKCLSQRATVKIREDKWKKAKIQGGTQSTCQEGFVPGGSPLLAIVTMRPRTLQSMTQRFWDKLFLKLSHQVILELLLETLICDIVRTCNETYSACKKLPPRPLHTVIRELQSGTIPANSSYRWSEYHCHCPRLSSGPLVS